MPASAPAVAGPAVPAASARPMLSQLQAAVVDLASSDAPLSRAWHEALAVWPTPAARAAWAARGDAPADLLAAAVTDRHPKVRSAAAGNVGVPLEAAARAGRSCAPYGNLMVATRPDCPDELAAELVAAVGTLKRRRDSWRGVLRARAEGLTGKPLALLAVMATCARLQVHLPNAVVAALDPAAQTAWLAAELTDDLSPFAVAECVAPLVGTPEQARLVTDWLDRWLLTGQVNDAVLRAGVALRFWCDPQPVTDRGQAQAVQWTAREMARRSTDPARLAAVVPLVAFDGGLVCELGENPAVASADLARLLAAAPTPVLGDLLRLGQMRGRARQLTLAELDRRDAAVAEPDVDVLALTPGQVRWKHEAALAVVMEPLLGTQAVAVFDELFTFESRVPVGRLLLTAVAVAGLALPAALLAAADLPVEVPPPDHAASWSGSAAWEDEPPF